MICVIQRVENAGVGVEGLTVGKCGKGLLILACAVTGDTDETVCKVADKILKMRIFEDEAGKLGKSVTDISGELLVVSNFTLCGSCRHGTRPDFVKAEKAGNAERLCSLLAEKLRSAGVKTEEGQFGADMNINCLLNGPVTIILDSDKDISPVK